MEWILVKDKLPEPEQDVYYYFEVIGRIAGKFYGVDPDEGPVFYSDYGWVVNDVTHWMPRSKGDSFPQRPFIDEEKSMTDFDALMEFYGDDSPLSPALLDALPVELQENLELLAKIQMHTINKLREAGLGDDSIRYCIFTPDDFFDKRSILGKLIP